MRYPFPEPVTVLDQFLGREEILEGVFERLTESPTLPCIVVGERVSGKTSFLKVLPQFFASKKQAAIQVHLLGERTKEGFVSGLVHALGYELAEHIPALKILAKEHRQPAQIVTWVKAAVEQENLSGYWIILVIDELDTVLLSMERRERDLFIHFLTDLIERDDDTSPLRFVSTTTSMSPAVHLLYASFVGKAPQFRLKNWTKSELGSIIPILWGQDSSVAEVVSETFLQFSGGNPFLVKALLRGLRFSVATQPGQPIVKTHLETLWKKMFAKPVDGYQLSNLHDHVKATMENIWYKHLNQGEKFILHAAATNGGLDTSDLFRRGKPCLGSSKRLVERGFLREEGARMVMASKVFAEIIKDLGDGVTAPLSSRDQTGGFIGYLNPERHDGIYDSAKMLWTRLKESEYPGLPRTPEYWHTPEGMIAAVSQLGGSLVFEPNQAGEGSLLRGEGKIVKGNVAGSAFEIHIHEKPTCHSRQFQLAHMLGHLVLHLHFYPGEDSHLKDEAFFDSFTWGSPALEEEANFFAALLFVMGENKERLLSCCSSQLARMLPLNQEEIQGLKRYMPLIQEVSL